MTAEDAVERAVSTLETLGLTEYEARCFVALLRLGQATAKEVSQDAGLPRSRVYDLADGLEERGLVVTYDTTPRMFQAVPRENALATLEKEHRDLVESAAEALSGVEPVEPSPPPREEGTTITDRERIVQQCRTLVETADEEVVLLLDADERIDELHDWLTAAMDRGVSVFVGVADADERTAVTSELPGATVFEPLPGWDNYVGGVRSILLVDHDAILASIHEDGDEDREVAVWGRGPGFPTVFRPLVERQVRYARDRADD